ncbi:hypothetical protein AAE02nite_21360 [Adhaeribacter aerolatus]|uniref:Uncharacterized protein n=1 Tax=Adhaeribacter aerolatus TaxID=670289 RepID=A0A512AXM4_9BACT|nr:hypothetical protein [Adhaeribacter aerolatus]GEO04472.1 hypothetical protein AAE02nite_21360 [Adhaeribacter aerolatus]
MKEDHIEKYLVSEYNYSIYNDLLKNGFFEPSQFFNLLYSNIDFVYATRDKPLTCLNQVKSTIEKFDEKSCKFFYEAILGSLYREADESLHVFIKVMHDDYKKRFGESYSPIVNYFISYNYFLDRKLEFPNKEWSDFIVSKKRKPASSLTGVPVNKNNITAEEEPVPPEKNKEFTTKRQVIAIHYLNKHIRINKTQEASNLARFIEFLTGKNYGNIYKILLNPLEYNSPAQHKKDLNYVKSIYESLQQYEIIKLIDNDLRDIG